MKPILFADDTNFFYSYSKNIDPSPIINRDLENIVKWLNANKLSLNIIKSKYIIFSHYTKKPPEQNGNITIDGQTIQPVAQIKFLGYVIESNLSWQCRASFKEFSLGDNWKRLPKYTCVSTICYQLFGVHGNIQYKPFENLRVIMTEKKHLYFDTVSRVLMVGL